MAIAKDDIQASRADELGGVGEAYGGKQKEASVNDMLIPPMIRYRQCFQSSDKDSTAGVYSLKFTSATSSVESFRTAFTSVAKGDEDDDGYEHARSERSSIFQGQYANRPMESTHGVNQTVKDGPLPHQSLHLPLTRAQPIKEADTLGRMHHFHKSVTKNIFLKLAKRKER